MAIGMLCACTESIALQNGEEGLLVNGGQIGVVGKQVVGGHQGEGGIRIPGGGILVGGAAGVQQLLHAGNGVEYRHGQIPVLLKGVGLKNGNRHGISPIS